MPFSKDDKNINRQGRPKNAEKDLLREALEKEGKKHGKPFWAIVANKAFTDKHIMVAVLKKFIADEAHIDNEHSGEIIITQMGTVKIDSKPLEIKIG